MGEWCRYYSTPPATCDSWHDIRLYLDCSPYHVRQLITYTPFLQGLQRHHNYACSHKCPSLPPSLPPSSHSPNIVCNSRLFFPPGIIPPRKLYLNILPLVMANHLRWRYTDPSHNCPKHYIHILMSSSQDFPISFYKLDVGIGSGLEVTGVEWIIRRFYFYFRFLVLDPDRTPLVHLFPL